MTYREIIYMVLDSLKLSSDDSFITQEHVLFLVSKIRAAILKQTYSNIKREIPESNYQTICLQLEDTAPIAGLPCEGTHYLKSKEKVPSVIPVGNTTIHSVDYYSGDITYVSRERMKYVGHNKWLKNIIYASLGPDQYMYFKSDNPQYSYLKEVQMTGIFEDIEQAANLSCDSKEQPCNILDRLFPLEEGLVTTLLEMSVKYLSGTIYKPADTTNNASDNLSELATFLKQNLKPQLQKQIEG